MTTALLSTPTKQTKSEIVSFLLQDLNARHILLIDPTEEIKKTFHKLGSNVAICNTKNMSVFDIDPLLDFDLIYIENIPGVLSIALRALHLLKDENSKIICPQNPDLFSLLEFFDLKGFMKEGIRIFIGSPKVKVLKPEKSHGLCSQRENIIKDCEPIEESPSSLIKMPEIPKEIVIQKKNKRVLLWVMNVCWRGGTALWLYDAICSLSNIWHHKVIFVNDPNPDKEIYDMFLDRDIDISYAPSVTKELVESIKPSAVFLSNTNPSTKIEGAYPWHWLTKNYLTIYIHHSAFFPWLEGVNTEIFVSEYLKGKYDNIKDRLRDPRIIYPGIHTAYYASLPRKIQHDKDFITVGYLANDNKDKYPLEIVDIMDASVQQYSRNEKKKPVCFSVVGGAKYLSSIDSSNLSYKLELLPFTNNVVAEYQKFDIFFYKTSEKLTDTWGRNITEAMASGLPVVTYKRGGPKEQISHGFDGFLCDNGNEYIESLNRLLCSQELRFEMGMNARVKAISKFDIRNFAQQIEPVLFKNALTM